MVETHIVDTTLGYGQEITAYGGTGRFYNADLENWNRSDMTPTFKCPTSTSATTSIKGNFFTASSSRGNGALTYPVGLITADEVVVAGSEKVGTDNSEYYLYKGHWYWTMSPTLLYSDDLQVYTFNVSTTGHLNNTYVTHTGAISPVIKLKYQTARYLNGGGTADSPFTIE